MRAKAVTADEQYRLIMECRASGMTDYQWCIAHNIKPGTFYNWVKRLRQSGSMDIPSTAGNKEPARQDIVEIHLGQSAAVVYTMVEMARAHGLNIYKYLKYLLERLPGTKMTDSALSKLAPWDLDVIASCSGAM